MAFLFRKDDKARLSAELIDELTNSEDPMEEAQKYMNLDILLLEGLLFGFLLVLSNVKDPVMGSLLFTCLMGILFAYSYVKGVKRHEAVSGKMFLEATTYIGDEDIAEQIEIEGRELLITPETDLDMASLEFDLKPLSDALGLLSQPGFRIGEGTVTSPMVEQLAKVRAEEYIDDYKRRQAGRSERHSLFFRRRKPKTDISYVEDERREILKKIESLSAGSITEENDSNGSN